MTVKKRHPEDVELDRMDLSNRRLSRLVLCGGLLAGVATVYLGLKLAVWSLGGY